MEVDKAIAESKCLAKPKYIWYHKGQCYASPYEGCFRKE